MMKKRIGLLVILSLFVVYEGFSQLNISYHQSKLPFIAVGYEFGRWTPEIRLDTDVFAEDMSVEAVLPYKFLRKEDYYLDAGLSLRIGQFDGIVLPIGLSVFPFEKKQFGFHTEAALLTTYRETRGLYSEAAGALRSASEKGKDRVRELES